VPAPPPAYARYRFVTDSPAVWMHSLRFSRISSHVAYAIGCRVRQSSEAASGRCDGIEPFLAPYIRREPCFHFVSGP
jgi:hypothetical protein